MAEYKIACIHCGSLADRDSKACPVCGSATPFNYSCPNCLRTVDRNNMACAGCGRTLHINCPICGQPTFVGDRCDVCGAGFTIICPNKRCGKRSFFLVDKCNSCGKKIPAKMCVATPNPYYTR
jgi:RNA polymerase subunit RPABC4/transcription elongation factor Spt4